MSGGVSSNYIIKKIVILAFSQYQSPVNDLVVNMGGLIRLVCIQQLKRLSFFIDTMYPVLSLNDCIV